MLLRYFNPRSLAGATVNLFNSRRIAATISIHAPSRERRNSITIKPGTVYFNPRSLAGATINIHHTTMRAEISIHAPSRERQYHTLQQRSDQRVFQSTLPRGSDAFIHRIITSNRIFQSTLPRGSDASSICPSESLFISIHAPSRERQHQNKLLLYSFKSSIFCELAQLKYSKIYFDVRKLIVSHSSLSCEPKLNFMFHITSHRIILHYFYSCQSICK